MIRSAAGIYAALSIPPLHLFQNEPIEKDEIPPSGSRLFLLFAVLLSRWPYSALPALYSAPHRSQFLWADIPDLPHGFLSVFDRRARTAADAGHTVGAVLAPNRPAAFHADIAERTDRRAPAARDASLCRAEFSRAHRRPIKQVVYNAAVQPAHGRDLLRRQSLSRLNPAGNPVDAFLRLPDNRSASSRPGAENIAI